MTRQGLILLPLSLYLQPEMLADTARPLSNQKPTSLVSPLMSAKYQLQTSDSLPAALAESKLVLDFQKRLVALPEPWGRSVMALKVLRRHRFLPAFAGIVGALAYAWLAASHIVS